MIIRSNVSIEVDDILWFFYFADCGKHISVGKIVRFDGSDNVVLLTEGNEIIRSRFQLWHERPDFDHPYKKYFVEEKRRLLKALEE